MIDIHKVFRTKEWKELSMIEASINEDGTGKVFYVNPTGSLVVSVDVVDHEQTFPYDDGASMRLADYLRIAETGEDADWIESESPVERRLDYLRAEWSDRDAFVFPLSFDPELLKKLLSAVDKEESVRLDPALAGVFVTGDGWQAWVGHKKEVVQ